MTASATKKQRTDNSPPPIDGNKPIQLERRRVYRACMPCRSVLLDPLPTSPLIQPNINHRRKKTKCSGTTVSPSPRPLVFALTPSRSAHSLSARSVKHLAPNAHGWRQRIGLLSVDSMYLSRCLSCILFLPQSKYLAMSKNSKRAYFIWSNSLNSMHLTLKCFHQRDQVFHRNLLSLVLAWSIRLCLRRPLRKK